MSWPDLWGKGQASDELAFRVAYLGGRLEGVWENVPQSEEGFVECYAVRLSERWNPDMKEAA